MQCFWSWSLDEAAQLIDSRPTVQPDIVERIQEGNRMRSFPFMLVSFVAAQCLSASTITSASAFAATRVGTPCSMMSTGALVTCTASFLGSSVSSQASASADDGDLSLYAEAGDGGAGSLGVASASASAEYDFLVMPTYPTGLLIGTYFLEGSAAFDDGLPPTAEYFIRQGNGMTHIFIGSGFQVLTLTSIIHRWRFRGTVRIWICEHVESRGRVQQFIDQL